MGIRSFFIRKRSIHLERLQEIALFKTLTVRELRTVDSLLHEREYLEDEIIFDQGEDGQAIYIVLEGTVSILRKVDGPDELVATYHPGEFFGELALLDRTPRAAQARAAAKCRMAVLFRADLMSLIDTNAVLASKITLQMARHLAHRLRHRVFHHEAHHL